MKKIIWIAMLLMITCFSAIQSDAQFVISAGISIRTAPPMMPVYAQPECPVDGYMWSPGYWAYDAVDGYYWVPGTWVNPPFEGDYWTPGYWGYNNGLYGWSGGYWGIHVGFYGGVNYGYGYGGSGFYGGEWRGHVFNYNTAVMNVNRNVVHNTYINKTVINNTTNNHYSFNGAGGVNAKPNNQEQMSMRENHIKPTATQISHNQTASHNHSQFASVNGGHPATTAMNKVGGKRFNEQGHNTSPVKSAVNNHSVNPNTDHGAVSNNHPVQIHNRPQQNHSPQPVQKRQPAPLQHAEQHTAGEPAHRKD